MLYRACICLLTALTLSSSMASGQSLPADASRFVEGMNQAYGKLQTLATAGSVRVNIDIAGQVQNEETSFTSAFSAPGSYRHELKDAMLLDSDGHRSYAFDPVARTYIQNDAPGKRVPTRQLPFPAAQVLQMQNPSLLFALSETALSELVEASTQQVVEHNRRQDQQNLDSLAFTTSDGRRVLLLADAQTHLLREMEVDMADVFVKRGAPDVKSAKVTIHYSQIQPGAKTEASQFAWLPPAGARERLVTASGDPISLIEGKPAPEFHLTDLTDKPQKLSDVRNKVVVLDFWATWCGPCVASLPELDAFYVTRKDSLAAFAVNEQEAKPEVSAFVKEHKLSLPVVLDTDGKVAEAYGVEGYPTTVIIGRDGKVRKVFTGVPMEGEEVITRAIDAVLAESSVPILQASGSDCLPRLPCFCACRTGREREKHALLPLARPLLSMPATQPASGVRWPRLC